MKKNNKKNKDWAPCSFTAQGINKCKKLLLEESFKKKVSLLQVERMPVACIIWDYDFRVMTWNPAAEKIFGYKAKDIIGKKAFDLILEKKDKDKIKKIQATILQGKRTVKDIRNNKTKKGKKIICEWLDLPLKDSAHQVVGILSMVQDVTESKNLEEKYKVINQELSKQVKNLKESKKNTNQILEGLSLSVEKIKKTERNLSDIIDFLPDATFALDKEKKVIIWNKAIERMTGINAEDMIGKGNHEYSIPFYGKRRSVLMDLIWKKDQKIIKKYSKIIREDACLSAEVFCSALYGGRGAYVYAKVSPLHDEKGRIIGAIESVRDITERKLAEDIVKAQALKISKAIAKDEAILQSIGDGLIVVGADGKILKTNLAFEKLTDWRGEEVIGHNFIKAVPRENEKGELLSFENEIIRSILKGNPIEDNLNQESAPFVWNYIRKDKTKFPGSSIINPIYLDEKVIGAVEVFRDITKEKELDLAKTEFLSLASHQLRTPLSGTKWTLELFLEDKDLSLKNRERLNDLYDSNERLINLVNMLLNVARIETGKWPVNKKMVNISEIIEKSCKQIKPNLNQRNQKIKLFIKTEIKNTKIDPLLFEEAFSNILSNSINYGPKDSVISVTVDNQDNYYLISIHNSGPAISKKDQAKIFKKFERGVAAQDKKTSGSGLGLFFSKNAIEINGGKIWFKSSSGKGTTFYFTVPKK
ncbi:MAG: PAS domain S-box protein [Candidatus Paceibacterota bacterium]